MGREMYDTSLCVFCCDFSLLYDLGTLSLGSRSMTPDGTRDGLQHGHQKRRDDGEGTLVESYLNRITSITPNLHSTAMVVSTRVFHIESM